MWSIAFRSYFFNVENGDVTDDGDGDDEDDGDDNNILIYIW